MNLKAGAQPGARIAVNRLGGMRSTLRLTFTRFELLWFALPALVVYSAFVLYPAASSFVLSLYDWSGIGVTRDFIGLGNFAEMFTSSSFWDAFQHTVVFFLAIAVFQSTAGLYIAVQLNERPRGHSIYRLLIFMPVTLSLVNTGFMWQLMLSAQFGLINPALEAIGLGSLARPWLADVDTALPAVILVQAWQWMGLPVVVFLAGLQSVRQDLLEAAAIDGANRWSTFRHVSFPQLAPAFTAMTILCFIRMFKVFDIVYVLQGATGSPAGRTSTLGTLIYSEAFGSSGAYSTNFRMSYAMAIAVVSAVFLLVFGGVLLTFLRRRERNLS